MTRIQLNAESPIGCSKHMLRCNIIYKTNPRRDFRA